MDITADTFGRLNQFGGCGQRFAKHAIGTLNQVVVSDRVPEQSQLPPALSGGDKPTSLRPLQTIKGRFVRQFDLVEGAKHSLQQEIITPREAESQRLAKREVSVSKGKNTTTGIRKRTYARTQIVESSSVVRVEWDAVRRRMRLAEVLRQPRVDKRQRIARSTALRSALDG